jgi:hypothetical protein
MIAKVVAAKGSASAFDLKSCAADRIGQAIETIGRRYGEPAPISTTRAHGDRWVPFFDLHGE